MGRGRAVSVAGRVFAVQVLAVLVIGSILLLVLAIDAQRAADDDAATTSLAVSRTVAVDPRVRDAVQSTDPTEVLEPFALELVDTADVDFVTIMSRDGIRFTHPDPAQIGGRFRGTISAAQEGEELTETFTGTLGPSVRAVVPIVSAGEVVGIVSAGVTRANIGGTVVRRIPFVLGLAVLVVALGTVAAVLTRRTLRRATGGLAPAELESMVGYYESVLHSVREGLVLVDGRRRVVLYNDEAADLLGLVPAAEARLPAEPADAGIEGPVADLLASGRRVVEETHGAAGALLLINQEPASLPSGRGAASGGTVMTLRDQSALQRIVGELDTVREMRDSLRVQAHEHANTVHTLVALLELGRVDEAIKLAAGSARTGQLLADGLVDAVGDPVLAAVLLGRAERAARHGVELAVETDPDLSLPLAPAGTVAVVGNLLDNAIEAAVRAEPPRWVRVAAHRLDGGLELRISDSGPGIPAPGREAVFDAGTTSKPSNGPDRAHGHGLTVARDAVRGAGGTLTFADGDPTTIIALFPGGTS